MNQTSELTKTCDNCGELLPAVQVFCTRCGTYQGGSETSPSAPVTTHRLGLTLGPGLVACPHCGQTVSDIALACPHCFRRLISPGQEPARMKRPVRPSTGMTVIFMVLAVGLLALYLVLDVLAAAGAAHGTR